MRNSEIDAETQREIKASYPEIFKKCEETSGAFLHDFDPRSTFDVTPEERVAKYEELWAERGFSKWMGNFQDMLTDDAANEVYAEFVRNKIRERIQDPVVAEMLVPKDHPFGSKRIPLETNYYEAYNRDNVLLVDVRQAPIESITRQGRQDSKWRVRTGCHNLRHRIRRRHRFADQDGYPRRGRPDHEG